jgi:hypothetical protein
LNANAQGATWKSPNVDEPPITQWLQCAVNLVLLKTSFGFPVRTTFHKDWRGLNGSNHPLFETRLTVHHAARHMPA